MESDIVIAVNENDEIVGYLEKLEVHRKGILHRAVSVFIFNSRGEWLLQQRSAKKYHSGLLWSNASCTHPTKGESDLAAANRRLTEEMGLRASLMKLLSFQYRAILGNELIENELDHVFIGYTDEQPAVDPEEVASYRYVPSGELATEINNYPERFTEWFKLLFERVLIEMKP
jgi:isopentenyl-diphosphate Delta-isomerase